MALTEFGKTRKKLEHLATQLAVANTHLYLFERIREAQNGKLRNEFYKSMDFWGFTLTAHIQQAVLHLCRIYDSHNDAFHFLRFLQEIPDGQFTPADRKQWKIDLAAVERQTSSRSIERLRKWRNNLIAHSNYDLSIGGAEDFLTKHPISVSELQRLIDSGFSILERWAYHCEDKFIQQRIGQGKSSHRPFKRMADGKDDFRHLVELIQSGSLDKTAASS